MSALAKARTPYMKGFEAGRRGEPGPPFPMPGSPWADRLYARGWQAGIAQATLQAYGYRLRERVAGAASAAAPSPSPSPVKRALAIAIREALDRYPEAIEAGRMDGAAGTWNILKRAGSPGFNVFAYSSGFVEGELLARKQKEG